MVRIQTLEFTVALLDLLHDLAVSKIKLWLEDDQLKFKAPKGALTPALRDRLVAQKPDLIAHLKKNLDVRQAEAAIPRANRNQVIPLSSAQRGVWFFEQNHPGTATYHISFARNVTGPLEREALEAALADMVARHESLRTSFPKLDGEPCQQIQESAKASLGFANMTAVPSDRQADMAREWVTKLATQVFDLEEGPLVRLALARLDDNQHLLVFVIHHLIADGWSMEVFLKEWATCYAARLAGNEPNLEPLPIQFVDFAVWEHNLMSGGEWDKQMAFWKETLSGSIPNSELPIKGQRPASLSSRGGLVYFEVDPSTLGVLRKYREMEGATPFMTFLSAFVVLLHRFSGQDDWWVGTPVAQRDRSELEKLIGFLVNTLVLRTRLGDEDTFESLHRRVQNTCLEAFAHAEVPFESLVEMLEPVRDPSRNPLVQVIFSFHTGQPEGFHLEGVTLEPFEYQVNVAHFDMTFVLENHAEQLLGFVEYNSDLFTPEFIERFAAGYQNLLTGIAADPTRRISEYALMDQATMQAHLAKGWRPSEWQEGVGDWQAWWDAVLAQGGTLVSGDGNNPTSAATFADLVKGYAQGLQHWGLKADQVIGVALPATLEATAVHAALLGLGATVVSLERILAADLLEHCRDQLGLKAVVAESVAVEIPVEVLELQRLAKTGENSIVFQGRGKMLLPRTNGFGELSFAEICHEDLIASLQLLQLAITTNCSDVISLLDERHPLWALIGLATTAIGKTWRILSEQDISRLTGADRALLLATSLQLASLSPEMEGPWRDLEVVVVVDSTEIASSKTPFTLPSANYAGVICWEDPVGVVGFGKGEDGRLPSGIAVRLDVSTTRHCVVVDRHGSLLPAGGEGEVWLLKDVAQARAQVQEGRIRVDDSWAIRTRALGKINDRGCLCILGRVDGWRKVRGFGIDASHMVSRLASESGIERAGFTVEWQGGDQQLNLWVLVKQGQAWEPEALQEVLVRDCVLPPDTWTLRRANQLQTNARGQVSWVSAFLDESAGEEGEGQDPQTAQEWVMAMVWADILGLNRIKRTDNFFLLGGHSLMAVRVLSRVGQLFDCNPSVKALFDHPTLEAFTRQVVAAVPS